MAPGPDLAESLLEEIRESRRQHSTEIAGLRADLQRHQIEHAAAQSDLRNRVVELEAGHARHRAEHQAITARAFTMLLAAIVTLAGALVSLWVAMHP